MVDYMLTELRGTVAAGNTGETLLTPNPTQRFINKTPQALAQIFTPDQVQMIRNIGADINRAQKSITGIQIAGRSNTAADTHGRAGSVMTQIIVGEALGNIAEHLVGHGDTLHGVVLGAAASMASIAANVMRAAGLKRVDDLVAQAMLHPEIVRTLLRVPATAQASIGTLLARQLSVLALVPPAGEPGGRL